MFTCSIVSESEPIILLGVGVGGGGVPSERHGLVSNV